MKKIIVLLAMALVVSIQFSLIVHANATLEEKESAALGHGVLGVRTLAGTGSHGAADGALVQFNLPFGVFALADGSVLVADSFNNLIRKINADGYGSLFAGRLLGIGADNFPQGAYHDDSSLYSFFYRPVGLAVNSDGWIFIADMHNHAVRVIVDGEVYTFAGGLGAGYAGGGTNAMFNRPSGITVCANGYVYVADTGNHAIRRISPGGYVTTAAGIGG